MSDQDAHSPYRSQSQSQSPQETLRLPRVGNRRPHRKSRSGCKNCKRRKVKCDELKPACSNCIRFSMVCDLSPVSEQKNLTQDHQLVQSLPRRGRGRPRKDWIPAPYAPRKSASGSSPDPVTGYDVMPQAGLLPNVEHLELMHAWSTKTATTVGSVRTWRDGIPELSFRYPSLCHGILAMAARHLSHLKPLEAERYAAIAEDHYTIAVTEATKVLTNLSGENAPAMYGTTMLIAFNSFARGPTPGDLLVFAQGKTVPWLCFLQGVKFIVQTLGHEAVFHGPFAIVPDEEPTISPELIGILPVEDLSHTWRQPLDEVLEMIEQKTSELESGCCALEMRNLIASYEATYGTDNDPKLFTGGKFQDIMGWLYRMEDEFIMELEAKQTIPLIILAYYAVLIKSLESFWFMKGWAKHLLQEIRSILDPQYARWLDWPEMQINYSGVETTLPIHGFNE